MDYKLQSLLFSLLQCSVQHPRLANHTTKDFRKIGDTDVKMI